MKKKKNTEEISEQEKGPEYSKQKGCKIIGGSGERDTLTVIK